LDDITEKDLEILNILSHDKGDEIRSQVAEILEIADGIEAENILIRLLKDEDGLVRSGACDSLRHSNSSEVLSLLIDIIKKDKTDLVRGYAASSIASILVNMNKVEKEYVDFFENLLKKETVTWVKLNIYSALYLLGESSYLYKLIEMLNHKHFRKRGAVVNMLSDIVSNENKEIIKSSLIELLKKEETINVRSSIENALKDIEKNMTLSE
jgi:FOG: HEAT repeat